MKRIRAIVLVVVAAMTAAFVPSAGHALPFVVRSVAINTAGVSDVVFDNGLVFGSQMQSGKIFVIDPTGGAIVTVLSVDVSRTHTLAADGVNHRVYVTNYDTGTMSVIDSAASPPVVLSQIAVGDRPIAIDVDPTTQRVFIGQCCAESRTVAVINAAVDPPVLLAPISVGQGPDHLAVDRSTGYVYVANYDSSSVSAVTGRTNPPVEIGFLALPKDAKTGRTLRPNALAVNPATDLLYVSVGDLTAEQHQIEIYDTTSMKSVHTIPTAQFIARDIVADPTDNSVWFTLPNNRFGNFYSLLGDRALTIDRKVVPHASIITPNFTNFAVDPATKRYFGAGQDSIVVMEDDAVAPAATVDALLPPVGFNFPGTPAVTHITGTATDDNSGIAAVIVRFDLIPTDTLHSASTAFTQTSYATFATVKCNDGARHTCTWDRTTSVSAGLYNVHITAFDVAGNKNPDDVKLTILVL